MSGMIAKLKNIVLNGTPKYRSAGVCPVYYAGRMGQWEVSKICEDGYRMIVKLKSIVLSDTLNSRSWLSPAAAGRTGVRIVMLRVADVQNEGGDCPKCFGFDDFLVLNRKKTVSLCLCG